MAVFEWSRSSKEHRKLEAHAQSVLVLRSSGNFHFLLVSRGVPSAKALADCFREKFGEKGVEDLRLIASPDNLKLWKSVFSELKIEFYKSFVRDAAYEVVFDLNTGKLKASKPSKPRAVPSSGPKAQSVQVPMASKKTRIYILDDSVTIRKMLSSMFQGEGDLDVVGQNGDPEKAIEEILNLKPDVLTLDIHMPKLNGVEVLRKLMPKLRVPTIVLSSISIAEGPLVLEALNAGALDYLQKPSFENLAASREIILGKIRELVASGAAKRNVGSSEKASQSVRHERMKSFPLERPILIGSSTGGTVALEKLFDAFPDQIPPVLVVQHIPAVFSKALADRLNDLSPFRVKEAEHDELVMPNTIYIAAGGLQMGFKSVGSELHIQLLDAPPVNRFKPSVDYMFDAFREVYKGRPGVGVILTGMGKDGAQGLKRLRESGWETVGQDAASSVVYGMPKEAAEIGAVACVVGIDEMAPQINRLLVELCSSKKRVA